MISWLLLLKLWVDSRRGCCCCSSTGAAPHIDCVCWDPQLLLQKPLRAGSLHAVGSATPHRTLSPESDKHRLRDRYRCDHCDELPWGAAGEGLGLWHA